MSLPAAYIGVILIWATTPLTVKWGGEGAGFLFAVTARMLIGVGCVFLLMLFLRIKLLWHRRAVKTYIAGVIGIYGAMMTVYWSAQYIPSGWISVLFGLSPIITAMLASVWLNERLLTPTRSLALFLGVAGLLVMYGTAADIGREQVYGIVGVLASTVLHGLLFIRA